MDQLRAMRAFAAVVEHGSFAAAAERLAMSRTAASRIIMDLEAHLGVSLFKRTTRRVTLTEQGASYFEKVRRVLDLVDDADLEAASETQQPRGLVRISAPLSFAVRHLSGHMAEFMSLYPDIEVELSLNDREVDLVREGYDFTVRIGELSSSSLIARRIASTRTVLCASPAYLANHPPVYAPDDLAGHTGLAYPRRGAPAPWALEDGDGAIVPLPVETRLWCNNGDALLEAAYGGAGLILQPDFIVHEYLARGDLVRILPSLVGREFGIFILYPPAEFMALRTRLSINYIAQLFAGTPPWQTPRQDEAATRSDPNG